MKKTRKPMDEWSQVVYRTLDQYRIAFARKAIWNPITECCEWINPNYSGYGSVGVPLILRTAIPVKGTAAHRMAWFLEYYEWPNDIICHRCDNRKCVNPKHLYLGTAKDNGLDKMESGNGLRVHYKHIPRVIALHKSGHSIKRIARRFGTKQSVIARLIRNSKEVS